VLYNIFFDVVSLFAGSVNLKLIEKFANINSSRIVIFCEKTNVIETMKFDTKSQCQDIRWLFVPLSILSSYHYKNKDYTRRQ
jgi:hypothetical protein